MKQKFIEWFTKNNNGCSPAMEDDRSFVYEMTQHMFEAYQAGVAEGEARCAALAAENAGLKESRKNLAEFIHEELDAGYPLNMSIETPATDAFLAEVRAQGVKSLSNAVQSVISERQRQQSVEGWTPEHDDEHTEGEMAEAAACYAMFANNQGFSVPGLWPWAREWWKQSGQRRDLVKAGALILAEIERIDRQESAQ
ncbi:hypothetical protein [Enterobacter rongchengensis]|uniref:hypothetical protein n=1 Tax=Enterobacter rongchengensis TaxID=3030999 RepID=UPI003658F4C7